MYVQGTIVIVDVGVYGGMGVDVASVVIEKVEDETGVNVNSCFGVEYGLGVIDGWAWDSSILLQLNIRTDPIKVNINISLKVLDNIHA